GEQGMGGGGGGEGGGGGGWAGGGPRGGPCVAPCAPPPAAATTLALRGRAPTSCRPRNRADTANARWDARCTAIPRGSSEAQCAGGCVAPTIARSLRIRVSKS